MPDPINRTVPDPGYVLCYDCGGSGICTNCDGAAKVDGKLCRTCSGRKYCVFCQGTGQVRPRSFVAGASSEISSLQTGASMLVARSSPECRLYIELHPHDCGEHRFPVKAIVERTERGLVARYSGSCPRCHRPRLFEFVLADELSPAAPAFGGATPSLIIDPGEFLYAADRAAKQAPDTVRGLSADQAMQAKLALEDAAAAIEEVIKFIPAGERTVPSSALHTKLGRETYLNEPGRFDRMRLEAVLDVYRRGVAQYDREITEMKYAKPRAEMAARAEQTAKTILDELDAPEDPVRAAANAAKEAEDAALTEVFYVRTGQRPPTARTRAEMEFAARLEPCPTCGKRELGELELGGSGMQWTVRGRCGSCGTERSFSYTSKGDLVTAPTDELGIGPSLLIRAEAFREELARVMPTIVSDRAAQRRALICLNELVKLHRAGKERDRLVAERDRVRSLRS